MKILEDRRVGWGGLWTEEKLKAFEKYVNAYLTIMNRYRDKNGWKLIYFDGFAGDGTRGASTAQDNKEVYSGLFNGNYLQSDELSVYKGAAERVVKIEQRGFDYYYFIDLNKKSNNKLKEKLEKYKTPDKNFIFRTDDANAQIVRMGDTLSKNSKYKALVMLDPFGMSIDWSSIESLKETSVDLWILIPSGVIINRLLDRKAHLSHIEKLKSYFGLTENEIKQIFYSQKTEETLFGEAEVIEKVEEPIKKIAELYVSRLKEIFKHVTDNPLVMCNTAGFPIYHFAFASNNKTALKIAKDIISKA